MLRPILIFSLFLTLNTAVYGQKKAVADAIAAQHFTFRALSITPTHGSSRQLTPEYTLRVTKDSLVAYLPYIGSQYTVPTPDEMIYGGYKFTVTSYSYKATQGKRGTWQIALQTNAQRDVQQMMLSCSKSGWGELRITSAGKDPVMYYGHIIAD